MIVQDTVRTLSVQSCLGQTTYRTLYTWELINGYPRLEGRRNKPIVIKDMYMYNFDKCLPYHCCTMNSMLLFWKIPSVFTHFCYRLNHVVINILWITVNDVGKFDWLCGRFLGLKRFTRSFLFYRKVVHNWSRNLWRLFHMH